jgi:hypothetical protein
LVSPHRGNGGAAFGGTLALPAPDFYPSVICLCVGEVIL